MRAKSIISPANILKAYNVHVNDIDLIKPCILSIDIDFRNDTPVVYGHILINDLYSLNEQIKWPDAIVKISYMDIFDGLLEKSFKVLDVKEMSNEEKRKNIFMKLQDTFSYTMEHSFLSKGYDETPANALGEYVTKLGLDTDYKTDFSKIDDRRQFIVPKHKHNLEFFTKEFKKYGYSFYQTDEKVCLKSQEDLKISKFEENDGVFTDETTNQLYKNRIIAIRNTGMNREAIQPKTRSLAFDHSKKAVVYHENNDNSAYVLNDDKTNLQDTQGYRDVYQQHLNFDQHDQNLRDSLLKQNQVEIIVNGYMKNKVNQIYTLELLGNPSTTEGQTKGNMVMSGKYVSTRVLHKVIGDSLIQKIYLERADAQKN